MSRTKIAVLIVIVVSVIIFLYYFSESQPKGKPQFEVVSFEGAYTPTWFGLEMRFQLKNIGNGSASWIYGSLVFDNSSSVGWGLRSDTVLQPGETSSVIFVSVNFKPTATDVTIVVECAERESQQFIVPLPQ